MDEIEKTFESIRLSYKDYLIALRLVDPIINLRLEKITIDKTNFANATNVIRDALLHRAILAITRIYDARGTDREVFEKLFHLMKQNSTYALSLPAIEKKYQEVKDSQHFKNLKSSRHGRIAHSLENRGPGDIDDSLHGVYYGTQTIIELIEKVLSVTPINRVFYKFWHGTGKEFWTCVFTEGGKYASSVVIPDPATSAG